MRISSESSDEAVLRELGERLARTRLEWNVSQAQLADEAGVSKATVERVESGREVKVGSLVRILRALNLLDALDRLIPEPLPNPVERARRQGRRRRRARQPQTQGQTDESAPWAWGTPDPPVGSGDDS